MAPYGRTYSYPDDGLTKKAARESITNLGAMLARAAVRGAGIHSGPGVGGRI